MKKYRSYVVLLVGIFCFIGIPTAHSLDYFDQLLNQQKIEIDLSAEEENTSKNENKEADGKDKYSQYQSLELIDYSLNIVLYGEFMFSNHEKIFEVSTPPPE